MTEKKEFEIIKGDVITKELDKTVFTLKLDKEYYELDFTSAYMIDDTGDGIRDCSYSVNGRTIKDLSFAKGNKIKAFSEDNELRVSEDGVKFLYFYEDIPTFDSDDYIWDGDKHTVIYRDSEGINLLSCRCGYRIPKIYVYIGLKEKPSELSEYFDNL